MSPWGKAGERISPDEAEERARKKRVAANKLERVVEIETATARRQWEAGLVRPYLITMWLDSKQLFGPEVDAACGVAEPTVDLWEAGRVYPTWEQLCALAELCGARPWAFIRELHESDRGRLFLCGRARSFTPTKDPVRFFDPLALAAAGLSPWPAGRVAVEEDGQGRLL